MHIRSLEVDFHHLSLLGKAGPEFFQKFNSKSRVGIPSPLGFLSTTYFFTEIKLIYSHQEVKRMKERKREKEKNRERFIVNFS